MPRPGDELRILWLIFISSLSSSALDHLATEPPPPPLITLHILKSKFCSLNPTEDVAVSPKSSSVSEPKASTATSTTSSTLSAATPASSTTFWTRPSCRPPVRPPTQSSSSSSASGPPGYHRRGSLQVKHKNKGH